jgi:hypothetical protein
MDGFSGALGFVNNLIEGLGGLPGVINLVGVALLNAFGPKAAGFLDNTFARIKLFAGDLAVKFTGGLSSTEKLRQEAMSSREGMVVGEDLGEADVRADAMNRETERT